MTTPFNPTPNAVKRLTATQQLTCQESYTRQQAIVSNFLKFFADTGTVPPAVQTLPVARLISMVDCEHCPGSHYVVVSKRAASAGRCVTTVLDVPLRRLYRAAHDTGMACFWKGVAKRRAGAVEFLQAGVSFRAPRDSTLRAELAPPPRVDSSLFQRAAGPDGVQPPA